jgi:DNA helicase-2/ATP-dependent DNA helicase PcrA
VDFDDLLLLTAHLLGDHPDLRERLEARFRYVLIDEYQDTNHAQYMIARGLTLQHENLCATGDPDQSIYAWRGADIRNILEFEQDYPAARVVRLEQNYRSTQRICAAASHLIRCNLRRKKKDLWSDNEPGDRVQVVECATASDEGDWVAACIQDAVRQGRPLSDFAVFYRVNALSRAVEESFLRAGISYQVARGTAFYGRKEIKDLLAWLRVLVNPADQLALSRAMTTPSRGIGRTTLQRLEAHARTHGLTLLEAARQVDADSGLGGSAMQKLRGFVACVDHLLQHIAEPPAAIAQRVFEDSGLAAALDKEEDPQDAHENIQELINAAADFTMKKPDAVLAEWLQQVALVSDVDSVREATGCVTLMTLHAAKGLEFLEVFIIGLEDGLLPHQRREERADVEEERRLLFVGMTRARKRLTLTRAQERRIHGITMQTDPSPFLKDLPRNDLGWLDTTAEEPVYESRRMAHRPQAGDFSRWKPGIYLRHPTFGVGQLMWKQGAGRQTRAGLRFPAYGEKTLILEFAKLEPLGADECQL